MKEAQSKPQHEFLNRSVLPLLAALSLMANGGSADESKSNEETLDSDEYIEELVVTGTMIHTGIDESAVPLESISEEEIEAIAPADIKDIFRNMTFNVSSLGSSSSNWVGDDGSYGAASVNVRNLGNGATLVLVDGKRVVASQFNNNGGSYVDIQTLLPTIALDHVDVLKDGTSAIYGSDAVAGVANLKTRKDFSGLDVQLYASVDHESGNQQDTSVEILYGGGTGQLRFTVAASVLDRGELGYVDRFEEFGRSGLSSFGQPGRYVPQVDASGPQPVTSNFWWPNGGPSPSQFLGSLPDTECEKAAIDDGRMGTLGLHPNFSHICVYDYSSFFAMVRPESANLVRGTVNYELDNGVEIYGTLARFDISTDGGNSFYPDVRYVIIPEHNLGLQLDAARRGFEPVPYQALQRVLGGTAISTFEERPVSTRDSYTRSGYEIVLGANTQWDLLGRYWLAEFSVATSSRKTSTHLPTDTISERMDLAFEGLGGPDCNPQTGTRGSGNRGEGDCYYYNSFQTSVYDPATGEKWIESQDPWDPDTSLTVAQASRLYRNPPELLQWVQGTYRTDQSQRQLVVDFNASADVTQFRGSPVSLAVGAQHRSNSAKTDYDDIANVFGYSFLNGDNDWSESTSALSLFTEMLLPLSDVVNLSAAIRREQLFDPDAVSLDPKVSLFATPTPDVSIRVSWGKSFKNGSLLQTGGSRAVFRNSSDPFSNAAALAYRVSRARGNPDLTPETAESFGIGITWEPAAVPGLQLLADWYSYDYSDLIVREGHQELIDIDNSLRCPNGVNSDPAAGPLCGVWDHDGDGVETVFSIGQGIPDRVIRREDGYLVRTEPIFLNANKLNASGLDAKASYLYVNDTLGDFHLSLSVTQFLEYKMTLRSGDVLDGLGKRNSTNSIGRPMPEYRSRTRLDWELDNHRAYLSVNTIGGYDDESVQNRFLGAYIGFAPVVESMTTVDAQYRTCISNWGVGSLPTWLSIGVKNLLNEAPPLVVVDGAYDYYSHDPRGRIYYARIQMGTSRSGGCTN